MRYGPNTRKKFSLPSYCLHHLSPFSVLCLPLGTKGTSLGCNFHLNLFCKRYRILHFFTERVLWHYLERCSFWPNKSVPMPQTTPSLLPYSWDHLKHLCFLCLPVPSASSTQRHRHTAAGLHHKGSNQDALEDKLWNLFSASGLQELTSLPHCKTHLLCSARVASKQRLLARVLSMHGLQTTYTGHTWYSKLL